MNIIFEGTEVLLIDDGSEVINQNEKGCAGISTDLLKISTSDLSKYINIIKNVGTKIVEGEIETKSMSPERISIEFGILIKSEGEISIVKNKSLSHIRVNISW